MAKYGIFLQIKRIECSSELFEQFYSGNRGRLDASRRFFQLRNRGLSKSLFSTATFLPLLECLPEGRGGRRSPSPHHMHTLLEERTKRRKAAESRGLMRTLLVTPTCGQQKGMNPRERCFFLNKVKASDCLIFARFLDFSGLGRFISSNCLRETNWD